MHRNSRALNSSMSVLWLSKEKPFTGLTYPLQLEIDRKAHLARMPLASSAECCSQGPSKSFRAKEGLCVLFFITLYLW
jgi:hypothetical protein